MAFTLSNILTVRREQNVILQRVIAIIMIDGIALDQSPMSQFTKMNLCPVQNEVSSRSFLATIMMQVAHGLSAQRSTGVYV